MSLYTERIAENEEKIEKLTNNIKRETARLKKLKAENDRLAYTALCEEYNCSGQKLVDILIRQRELTEKSETAGSVDSVNEADNSSADDATADDNDAEFGEDDADPDDNSTDDTEIGQTSFFTEKRNPYSD